MIGVGIPHGHEIMDFLSQLHPVGDAVVRGAIAWTEVMFCLPYRHVIGVT